MTAVLATAVVLAGGYVAVQWASPGSAQIWTAEPTPGDEPGPLLAPVVDPGTATSSSTTTSSTTATSTTTTPPPPAPEPPILAARYVVPVTEAEPEAKQLATDVASSLTTYEASDEHMARFEALGSRSGADLLAAAAAPLTHAGSWSRGEVVYPQLGGLRNGRASVMVVTRQTVGSDAETGFSVVRTLDIRLVRGDSGWEFDFLASAGGTFEHLEDLAAAHAVAGDPRIEMPDSARLDILAGGVSPKLLRVMAELADQTPYEVVVLTTGHPINVFETDRRSQHTVGQAVDINRIGDRLVVDDRDPDSATRRIVDWLYAHPDVRQVGSPWDVDGSGSSRSFTDAVHQDHIHLAVDGGA
jgi:hypothetical protein